MRRHMHRNFFAVAAAVGLVVAHTGCAGDSGKKDAAGLSESQVAALSFDQQYETLGQRYERMHELLADIQRQVSDDDWAIHDSGMMLGGDYGISNLPGVTSANSYFLSTTRSLTREDFTGKVADLDPVIDHFSDQGYDVEVHGDEADGRVTARALTDDGWRLAYIVQANGQYNVRVVSGTFWGPFHELLAAWMDRVDDMGPDSGPPGLAVPFPKL